MQKIRKISQVDILENFENLILGSFGFDSKDDRDQRVGEPSLKTPIVGPWSKS